MAIEKICVPDIGNFKDVDVIEINVKVGDSVQKEDALITLESDKATMDVPSPVSGIIKEIIIKIGDKASEGSAVAMIEVSDGAVEEKPAIVETPSVSSQSNQSAVRLETVSVPDIGNFKGVDVIEIGVKVGDSVKKEDALITLESDKATMDVPSPLDGIVKEIKIKIGDKASEGTPVLVLEVGGGESVAPVAQPSPVASPTPATPTVIETKNHRPFEVLNSEVITPPVVEISGAKSHASPSIRKFARELGVNLELVRGSGPKNRVLKEDVFAFVKGELNKPKQAEAPKGGLNFGLPEMPEIDFSKFGEIESKPLSRINKLSGANLHRNWLQIPHVTQFDQADITNLEAFRKQMAEESKKDGIKITMLAFLLKASAKTLEAFPRFNASLDKSGENLILKKYIHIGVAVDTPDGLVVPVIRDVNKKGIFDLAKELGEISEKARAKKISPAEMQGGCFSISSLGGIGGTAFTPIINAPEVAILGVSKSSIQPVFEDGEFKPKLMLPLSLSYDHRVIDGAAAARFTTHLAKVLTDIRRVLL